MSTLPLLIDIPLDDVLERYAPELAFSLNKLENANPERAASLRKGWSDDLKRYMAEKVEPVYERLKKLNPVRMHHDWQLWEEITAELAENLEIILNVWQKEISEIAK